MRDLKGMLFVTVHPDQLSPHVLDTVDIAVALGEGPSSTLQAVASHKGLSLPHVPNAELKPGEAILWRVAAGQSAHTFMMTVSRMERRRHRRKYAEGELPPERSFYFRGPEGKLNLRAQNLIMFRQLADGVDDATWLHHLRKGDYSRWMETAIKDPSLAQAVQDLEDMPDLSAHDSRQRVASAIEERYTLPATGA
jgi:hypothetical protein